MSTPSLKLKSLLLISVFVLGQVSASIIPISGSSCCSQNSIDVSGSGKVQVQPDIAYINLAVTAFSKTSQGAVEEVASLISQINDILAQNKIP